MIKHQSRKAFTLIEITLVLGLILGLAAALIFGLAAFSRGADRAKCILNITNVQKAMRSFANLNELTPGDSSPTLVSEVLWGTPDSFLSTKPVCPRVATDLADRDDAAQLESGQVGNNDGYIYTLGNQNIVPGIGIAYISCTTTVGAADPFRHVPRDIDGVRQPR